MNRSPDVDLVLRDYFAGDDGGAPDYVLDVVEERIRLQPRRRAWRLQGRPNVNLYAKLAAAAAAVLVVGFVGWRLLPGDGGIGGEPTPAPTAAATTAASPPPTASAETYSCEEGTGCAGFLAAGTHATTRFAPAFSYTVPDDWMNPIDIPTIVGITPIDRPADLILVWSGVVPAEQTATCELRAKPGEGATVDDWIAFLDAHPGLDATNIQTHSISGASATSVDVRSFGGYTSPCVDDRAGFNVPIVKTPAGAPGDGYGVRIGAEARIFAIDAGAETVIVTVYSYGGDAAAFQEAVDLAEPVVTSFDFGSR